MSSITARTAAATPRRRCRRVGAARFDLYAPIHKALRGMMSDTLCSRAASTCTTPRRPSPRSRARCAARLAASSHLEHENEFVHAAIEARRPHGAARTADDHVEHLASIEALRAEARALQAPRPRGTPAARAAPLSPPRAVRGRELPAHAHRGDGQQRGALGATTAMPSCSRCTQRLLASHLAGRAPRGRALDGAGAQPDRARRHAAGRARDDAARSIPRRARAREAARRRAWLDQARAHARGGRAARAAPDRRAHARTRGDRLRSRRRSARRMRARAGCRRRTRTPERHRVAAPRAARAGSARPRTSMAWRRCRWQQARTVRLAAEGAARAWRRRRERRHAVEHSAAPSRGGSCSLQRLHRGDELVERLAPPVVEAHALVRCRGPPRPGGSRSPYSACPNRRARARSRR